MKIALYYPWIYLTSGAERTVCEYVKHSRHDVTIFTSHFEPERTFPELSQMGVVELGHVSVKRSPGAFAHAVWTMLRTRLPMEQFDALIVVSDGIGDLLLLRNASRPAVCLSLTPLRIAFDEHYAARYMESLPAHKALLIRAGAAVYRSLNRFASRSYRKVVTNGRETRRRVVKGRLAPVDRIEILNPAITFHPEAPAATFERFFLIAGRIMWTKNIELGIEAFHRFRAAYPDSSTWRLVIAGMVDRKSEPYLTTLQQLGNTDSRIEFVRDPSDQQLRDLYSRCYSVLYTPFNEDYGLIPLEAMAYGKPSIAVGRGGPLEVVTHGVDGILSEPDASTFADQMKRLADDPEGTKELGRNGYRKAQQHTWANFASRLDEIMDEVVSTSQTQKFPSAQPMPGAHY